MTNYWWDDSGNSNWYAVAWYWWHQEFGFQPGRRDLSSLPPGFPPGSWPWRYGMQIIAKSRPYQLSLPDQRLTPLVPPTGRISNYQPDNHWTKSSLISPNRDQYYTWYDCSSLVLIRLDVLKMINDLVVITNQLLLKAGVISKKLWNMICTSKAN